MRITSILTVVVVLSIFSVPVCGITVQTVSTADNYYDLYLDGNLKVTIPESQGSWNSAETWIGTVAAGTHAIAVKGYNDLTQFAPFNPAGFRAQIVAVTGTFLAETNPTQIVTDASWMVYDIRDATPPNQGSLTWTDPAFVADAAHDWAPAYVISYNWGDIYGISSSARWIWNADWYPPPSGPGDTPVYLRRTFTVVASSEPDPPDPQAIPEPVSLVSGAMGLACVGAYLRRRTRMR
jgi:hypothetical protein